MQKITVLVFAVTFCMAAASRGNNFHFDPYTLVTCMAQNPSPPPYSLPVNIPRLPPQPGEPGSVYLPIASEFRSPVTGPIPGSLTARLLAFLGADYNDRLTFIGEETPRNPPIIPGTILPLPDPDLSSGDRQGGVGRTLGAPIDYTGDVRMILETLPGVDVVDHEFIISVVNRLTDRCDVRARWVKLPDGQYFPQWISGAYCSGNNCSLPAGLICEPIVRDLTLVYITILRWDCCWSFRNHQWRWECGWMKVQIPFITQCHCGCGPEFDFPFSHTGRIGGPYQVAIEGLNT